MFVLVRSARFKIPMWSDSRLVDLSPPFCLCSSCAKGDIVKGKICQKHDEFMKMTQALQIAAPVFSCPDFAELEGGYNFLDDYYDGNKFSTASSGNGDAVLRHKIKLDWDAQVGYWKENGFSPELVDAQIKERNR